MQPNHSLFRTCSPPGFTCNLCRCPGFGSRYRCVACDFDRHESCQTCPQAISCSQHPQHQLSLQSTPHPPVPRFCDGCRFPVQGIHYRCQLCDFNLHPQCIQLPPMVHPSTSASASNNGGGGGGGGGSGGGVGSFLLQVGANVLANALGVDLSQFINGS